MCVDKVCTCCGETKPKDAFSAKKTACKPCRSSQQVAYAQANPHKRREYTAKNKATIAARRSTQRKARAEKENAYVAANREKINAQNRARNKAHPEKIREKMRAHQIKHPHVFAANAAKRRAKKLMATPAWANEFIMAEAYQLAALRTKILGFEWQVDHIVPLQSDIVCGLHAHTNIQVIPRSENIKKGNRVWEGMP